MTDFNEKSSANPYPLRNGLRVVLYGASERLAALRSELPDGIEVLGSRSSLAQARDLAASAEADGVVGMVDGWPTFSWRGATSGSRASAAPQPPSERASDVSEDTGSAEASEWRTHLRAELRQLQAERKDRGERIGPRPNKAWRRHTEKIVAERASGASLQDIARELNETGTTPPGGGRWHAASVKRALDFGIVETELLLRRLGGLLVELSEEPERITPELLAHHAKSYRIHPVRLWAEFADMSESLEFAPVVVSARGRIRDLTIGLGRDRSLSAASISRSRCAWGAPCLR